MREKIQYKEKSNNEIYGSNILTNVEIGSSNESEILKYGEKRKDCMQDIDIEAVVTIASSDENTLGIKTLTIENEREASEQLEIKTLTIENEREAS